jgi:hypothetical protein
VRLCDVIARRRTRSKETRKIFDQSLLWIKDKKRKERLRLPPSYRRKPENKILDQKKARRDDAVDARGNACAKVNQKKIKMAAPRKKRCREKFEATYKWSETNVIFPGGWSNEKIWGDSRQKDSADPIRRVWLRNASSFGQLKSLRHCIEFLRGKITPDDLFLALGS